MRKIYWAAPLHDKEDQERNNFYVGQLRKAGHKVYVPQEHGVWEDMLSQFGGDEKAVRQHLYTLDMNAMREAELCVACCGDMEHQRGPSEGMLWEMGWFNASNKSIILFNENSYWRYNLMPQFGATYVADTFDKILAFLKEEAFQ